MPRSLGYLSGVSDAGREMAMRHLAVHAQTLRVIKALHDSRVDCVLLKGIGHERWLYPDEARPVSQDVDVLVEPNQFDRACATVSALGMRLDRDPRQPERHARELKFVPAHAGGVPVELHPSFHFLNAPPERCWALLAAEREWIDLGGMRIAVPSVPARASLTALHAAFHGRAGRWTIEDLRRALLVVSLEDWRRAACLARDLGAPTAFASGLRLLPAGAEIADALGIAKPDDPTLVLHGQSAAEPAFRMLEYVGDSPVPGLVRLLGVELIPPPDLMRTWYPIARRGRRGLLAAHVARLLRLGLISPRLLSNWRQARAAARHF